MQTAATDVLVGRKLEGRYRILDRIARGGMSTVYAAVDERLDRMVAVKVMSTALSADPAFSDRFAREARAAARLTHLNVVSVYDQGHEIAQDGHHVFLVMELVTGRTLRELIRERGRLTTPEAVSIMEPVLSALSAAHRAGLVHRDVKPENILLSDEGVVKVADFGLAHAVETDPSSTRTGLMMGTVAYCAPEQIARGEAGPSADVYAAGIVLFELLTGNLPYSGESAMNIAYQHVHSRVPSPSSRIKPAEGIPSEIDEIVIAATDSDPAGRPGDAGAFLAELADVRAELGLPIVPVPARPREAGHRRPERPRSRTPERATTDAFDGVGADTALVSGPGAGGTSRLDGRDMQRRGGGRDSDARDSDGRDSDGRHAAGGRRDDDPPPPVVIRPPSEAAARKRRRRRSLIVTVLVLALGLGAFFGAKAFIEWRFAHVPKINGATIAGAKADLRDAGYDVRVNAGKVFSDSVPRDHVLRSDPAPGSRLATGNTVTLTISNGRQLFTVPQTRNSSVADATAALNAAGDLTIKNPPQLRYDDKIDKGSVIGTSPAAGARVSRDQAVTIVVSQGPPTVDVPAIEPGTPLADATKQLEDADFEVRETQEFSDTVAEGTVVSVSPADHATKFSTITVSVSQGPAMVTVPDISAGDDVTEAAKKITDAKLVPDVRRYAGSGDGGVVLTLIPGSGSTVRAGSTVTIYAVG